MRIGSRALTGALIGLLIALAFSAAEGASGQAAGHPRVRRYPPAPRQDVVDVLHGTKVPDPYRGLEQVDSPETAAWVKRENKLTADYLRRIPLRAGIHQRLTELRNRERFSAPVHRGDRWFMTRNEGLQSQDVLYWMPSPGGDLHSLLDPNGLSKEGTVSLSGWEPSRDGKLLAYGLSEAGSDWVEWRVRNVDTGQDLGDHLKWVKFSDVAWTPDGQGFFYSRYDEPKKGEELKDTNFHQKLYCHRLGAPQSEDALIYQRPDQKGWGFDPFVTEDGRYLVISVWNGNERETGVFYRDLSHPQSPVVELLRDFDAAYTFAGNDGGVFYLQTDLKAPLQRVIAIDVAKPARENWREVVPEYHDAIDSLNFIGGRFLVVYLHDAYHVARAYREDGTFERDVTLPGLGTLSSGFVGLQADREAFYLYTDFVTPEAVYRYDVASGENTVLRRPRLTFDPSRFVTEQVFYRSKDGTRVPMFVCRRKDLKPGPNTPCSLWGYGGFGVSSTPAYSGDVTTWLEMGGIFAQASIRGGGEYGKAWHEGGRRLNEQNRFDDFIAAAEWLIANGYTSTPHLAIMGASNGGLLVGACLTQRPDLFGCCVAIVGVMDMIRFPQFTIGWSWTSEYGDPKKAEDFRALLAYSPYHNVKPGTKYPPTLLSTGDHDDRVFPAHSYKFAAALQAAQAGDAPILLRVARNTGHGDGMPTAKVLDEWADVLAFAAETLGVKPQ